MNEYGRLTTIWSKYYENFEMYTYGSLKLIINWSVNKHKKAQGNPKEKHSKEVDGWVSL